MAYSDIFQAKALVNDVPTTKGTDLMEAMLLSQYENSPNLKEYYGAFFEEMDLLFEHLSKVYLGRTLEYAQGKQLDIIGEILQQKRTIELPTLWFGFAGTAGVAGMADEATPSVGGTFRGEESEGYTITPLDDATYRKVLRVKAMLHVKNDGRYSNLDRLYSMIAILIGRIPQTFEVAELPNRVLQLTISASEVSQDTIQLINYMSRYFTPLGAKFTIIQL